MKHKRSWAVVETDNFGGDYPDERFVVSWVSGENAKKIAEAINAAYPDGHHRYYFAVEMPYELKPGFEP